MINLFTFYLIFFLHIHFGCLKYIYAQTIHIVLSSSKNMKKCGQDMFIEHFFCYSCGTLLHLQVDGVLVSIHQRNRQQDVCVYVCMHSFVNSSFTHSLGKSRNSRDRLADRRSRKELTLQFKFKGRLQAEFPLP